MEVGKKIKNQNVFVGLLLNLLIILLVIFFGDVNQPWYVLFVLMIIYPCWMKVKKLHFFVFGLSSSIVILLSYLWIYADEGLESIDFYPAYVWILFLWSTLYFHFSYKMKIRKVQKQKKSLFAMFENASEAIFMVNQAGEIEMANKYGLSLFKYQEEELIGKPVEMLVPNKYSQSHVNQREKYFKSPKNRPMGAGLELYGLSKEGTEFPVEVSLGYFKDKKETKVIVFIMDVSARLQAEIKLQKLNAQLESKVLERTSELESALEDLEKNNENLKKMEVELIKSLEKERELGELKSRFLTMASHEFRTPLSTILSSVFLLENFVQEENPQDKQVHLARIRRSVNNMTAILNDFLSLSKLDEGHIVQNYSETDIREFMEGILDDVKALKKEGQQLIFYFEGEDIPRLLDQQCLRHIITNLLSNALKFSKPESNIELKVNNHEDKLEIEVKDSGIGIPEEDKKHLFDRFFRAKNAVNIEGTGLGLSIVRRYVEMLKGSIEVKSQLNKGTSFKVLIPLSKRET